MKKDLIISIGEIVWDQFAETTVLGGAPLNVAYHLQAQGWPAMIISRVGDDELGRTTIDKVKKLGLPVQGIQQDPVLPTGRVLVSLDARNQPHFDIAAPAAWDNIQLEEALSLVGDTRYHLVFGTLAQRNETSRQVIERLCDKALSRFYDVNLRPPHTPAGHVRRSLAAADVLKVNREELLTVNDWFMKQEGPEEDIAGALLTAFDLSLLAVTDGANGARLITRDRNVFHPGFPVQAVDPVGSGDAFFSALIIGYLSGLPLDLCLEQANRAGAYVASQTGATPEYPGTGSQGSRQIHGE
ncbi:MAG TPA: carbohydrate kinase [Desulfobacteraceae bacterium]|nr:carbohydrate kinase [Desulfobacteraceae bacterium]